MSRLEIYLLGYPNIIYDGKRVPFERNRAMALIAYLAVTSQRHTRQDLAKLLWHEGAVKSPLSSLRKLISGINNTFVKNWLDVDTKTIYLRRDDLWVDVVEFEQLVRCRPDEGQACTTCLSDWEAAINRYQADFLADFQFGNYIDTGFNFWMSSYRQTLRGIMNDVLQQVVECYQQHGRHDFGVECCQALARARPSL